MQNLPNPTASCPPGGVNGQWPSRQAWLPPVADQAPQRLSEVEGLIHRATIQYHALAEKRDAVFGQMNMASTQVDRVLAALESLQAQIAKWDQKGAAVKHRLQQRGFSLRRILMAVDPDAAALRESAAKLEELHLRCAKCRSRADEVRANRDALNAQWAAARQEAEVAWQRLEALESERSQLNDLLNRPTGW